MLTENLCLLENYNDRIRIGKAKSFPDDLFTDSMLLKIRIKIMH